MNKKELILVFNDTKSIVSKIETNSQTKKYSYNNLSMTFFGNVINNITVVPTDTITTTLKLKGRTCILNMTSNRHAGGGVVRGAKAQEESLFRCTNLFETVIQDYYPLKDDECLYSTDIIIVKDANYNVLEEPIKVDCITLAAPNLNYHTYEKHDYDELIENKIKMMLSLPSVYHCDNLVLGAWGCGVYNNDPEYISNKFYDIIKDNPYTIKNIIFGVINDDNSVDDNYTIFSTNLW